MDRRALAALGAGLAGLAAGVASALGLAVLAVPAGACALVAASLALAIGADTRALADEAAELTDRCAALEREAAALRAQAEQGREAMRVADTFAEMVALRNVELTRQAGGLVDEASGLLDGRYFEPALTNRVAAARRLLRPVSVVLLDLHDVPDDKTVGRFAAVLRETLREADTACRLGADRFGLILEDTPEGGGVWAAERIRASFARGGGPVERLAAGVAAYPSHALDAAELLARAEQAVARARAAGRGQVEVAATDG